MTPSFRSRLSTHKGRPVVTGSPAQRLRILNDPNSAFYRFELERLRSLDAPQNKDTPR